MIETPRLWLVSASASMISDLIAKRPLQVGNVPIHVPTEWADLWIDHPGALEYTLNGLQHDTSLHEQGWWAYLTIHAADQTLVGMGGFKGKPDATGTVEIGYSISSPYRQQGLATEVARGLSQFALDHADVKRVMAHTLAVDNYSNRLLKSIGFQYNGQSHDPDEGNVWQWIMDETNN
ncbi:GNAT family N-acetyltransferase [Fibrella forsythiae]|uniref:GNAT family N-acetyltransferase n=1 Tax=Fibrella forsythiae TaxID=2817061 RepID=A0ABS3JK57_9BACT|nr:GNAT family N-acetyltransferase [Fibrella forsythiae]MBO0950395.1 GNAT family N-acetyltransferase [Fibrella forsythiae]